jgi:adenine deaminase
LPGPEFFRFPAPISGPLPVIRIADKTVTRRLDLIPPIQEGLIQADPHQDLAKIALIHRQGKGAGMGLVSGFGARLGAIAASIAHETHHLMVLGFEDRDMARAIREVVKMGGGIAVVKGGKVLGRLPLPVGGIMSSHPVAKLAGELGRMTKLLKSLGSPLEDPLWTLGFLSFTSLIELRITPSGVYEVKTGRILYNGWRPA